MSVFIATDAGAHLVIDVGLDNNACRLAALNRHLGAPGSWTVNAGTITAMRDGAEALEFDVDVTGVFAGSIQLQAPGGQVVAVSTTMTLAANEKGRVRFRISRNHDRDLALADTP